VQEGKERRRTGEEEGGGIITPSFLFLIVVVDAFVIGVIIIGLHGRMDEEFLRRSRKRRRRRRRKSWGTFFLSEVGRRRRRRRRIRKSMEEEMVVVVENGKMMHEEVKDWKEIVRKGGSLQNVQVDDGRNGWATPSASSFLVRGRNFFQRRVKVAAGDALFKPLAVDWLKSNARLDHVLAHPGNVNFSSSLSSERKDEEILRNKRTRRRKNDADLLPGSFSA
jgi:hypothetical protein